MSHHEENAYRLRSAEPDQTGHPCISSSPSWLAWLRHHRSSVLIGGGLLGGFALAAVPPKSWSGVGALVFGGVARLARSPFAPALLGAFCAYASNSRIETGHATLTRAGGAGFGASEPVVRSDHNQ